MGGSLLQQNLVSHNTVDVVTKYLKKAYEQTKTNKAANYVIGWNWVGGGKTHSAQNHTNISSINITVVVSNRIPNFQDL